MSPNSRFLRRQKSITARLLVFPVNDREKVILVPIIERTWKVLYTTSKSVQFRWSSWIHGSLLQFIQIGLKSHGVMQKIIFRFVKHILLYFHFIQWLIHQIFYIFPLTHFLSLVSQAANDAGREGLLFISFFRSLKDILLYFYFIQ